jgi:hypothetical protein
MSIYLKGLNVINKHLKNIISIWKGKKTDLFKLIDKSKIKTIKNPNKNQLKKDITSFSSITKTNNLNTTIFNLIKTDKYFTVKFNKQKNSISHIFKTNFSDYNFLIKLNKKNYNNTNINSSNNSLNIKSINNIRNYVNKITKFSSKSAYSLSKNYNYNFNNSLIINNKLNKNLYTFLESSFYSMSSLISKPIFIITPEKIIIQIFYYKLLFFKLIKNNKWRNKIINFRDNNSIFNSKFNILKLKIISQILARYFKKSVEFELIKLNNPYYNSNILVKLLGLIINKTKLRKIKNNIFRGAKTINSNTYLNNINSNIPSYLAGIKIKVAGRLLTQRVIPRKTVKIINKGALARGKVIYLDSSRFTNKNKRGAFSITVFTGHVKF